MDFLTSELSKFNEIRESLSEGKAIALKYLILGGTRWPVSCEEIITLTCGVLSMRLNTGTIDQFYRFQNFYKDSLWSKIISSKQMYLTVIGSTSFFDST